MLQSSRVVRHEMYWDPYLQSPLSHSNNFEYDEDEVDDSADKEDSGGNAGSALLFSWAAAGAFMVAAAGLTAE